jgi:hypothetical protein
MNGVAIRESSGGVFGHLAQEDTLSGAPKTQGFVPFRRTAG